MINNAQLREYVIKPALQSINSYSEDAEELLVFTCATESLGGSLLHQINGPALGIFQMEPGTYHDIWRNYIFHRNALLTMMTTNLNAPSIPPEKELITNLKLAAAMARIHYLRVKEPLPKKDNAEAIWNYYKKYYNTELGKATREDSLEKYKRYGK